MITKHIIVNEIANNKEYKSLCRKFSPKLHEDLYQDLMVILLTYDESKLIFMHQTNKIKFFIIKILMNQTRSYTSPLYTQHSKKPVFEDVDWYEETDNKEPLINALLSTIELYKNKDEDNFYRARLFELYVLHGSIRSLSKVTKIPVMSIQRSLADFKIDIKNLIDEDFIDTSKQEH